MKTKAKIEYGNVEIPDEAFESRNVKERITIMLDQDIVDAFRAKAARTHGKYQTLINEALRESLAPKDLPDLSALASAAFQSAPPPLRPEELEAVRRLIGQSRMLQDPLPSFARELQSPSVFSSEAPMAVLEDELKRLMNAAIESLVKSRTG